MPLLQIALPAHCTLQMLSLPIATCKLLPLPITCSADCSRFKLLPLQIAPTAYFSCSLCSLCPLLSLPIAPAAFCSRCLSLLLPISSAAYCSCFYRLHFISLPKLLPISLRCPLLLLLIASTADNSHCLLVLLHMPLCCLSLPVLIAFATCFQKSPTVGTLKLMVALPPTPR